MSDKLILTRMSDSYVAGVYAGAIAAAKVAGFESQMKAWIYDDMRDRVGSEDVIVAADLIDRFRREATDIENTIVDEFKPSNYRWRSDERHPDVGEEDKPAGSVGFRRC